MASSSLTSAVIEMAAKAALLEAARPGRKRSSGAAKGNAGSKRTKKTDASTLKPKGARRPANAGFGRGKKALEKVHNLLSDLSVSNAEGVSSCLKAAILNGSLVLKRPADDPNGEHGLDQALASGECMGCGEDLTCRVRDVLYQPDYAGLDYEDGGLNATFKCTADDCSCGIYITGICRGNAHFDSGKSHNHCTECPRFGMCVGDYREAHCPKCNRHFFAGLTEGGFECENCTTERSSFSDSECDLLF